MPPPASAIPAAPGEQKTVVFVRGGCFFSTRIAAGQDLGYDVVIVDQSHGGTRNGLLPDAFFCGGQGHDYDRARGASYAASTEFDGWGYVQLHDARDANLRIIDSYAVPEALDEAFADGFGTLSVHEVKTDPRANVNLAYISY